MKAHKILAMAVLSGAAFAQSAPASQKVADKPQVKSAPVQVVQPKSKSAAATPKSATTPAPSKNAASVQAKPVQVKPVQKAAAPAVKRVQKTPAENAREQQKAAAKKTPEQLKAEINAAVAKKMAAEPNKEEAKKDESSPEEAKAYRGKRDPFVSPIVAAGKSRMDNADCKAGKKCLVIDQIVLKGIVQMKSGNIALVENSAKRPYVLHESDALFNGSVQKITPDSVVFRQTVTDLLGHTSTKEVVKKVSAPAV